MSDACVWPSKSPVLPPQRDLRGDQREGRVRVFQQQKEALVRGHFLGMSCHHMSLEVSPRGPKVSVQSSFLIHNGATCYHLVGGSLQAPSPRHFPLILFTSSVPSGCCWPVLTTVSLRCGHLLAGFPFFIRLDTVFLRLIVQGSQDMRLLVVTNCRAQVAQEVVLQQEQAPGSAWGLEESADDSGSIRAWIQLDQGSPVAHLTLSHAAQAVMLSPKCHTHTPHTGLFPETDCGPVSESA